MADENNQKESLVQTVKRNLTPEVDTSRSALPPDQKFADQSPQQQGEQEYDEAYGAPLQVAYGKVKKFLSEHEQHLSDEVLKPFRQGLDKMGDDLVEKGLATHSAVLAGTGEALKMVPVGKNVKETAQALIAPPEVAEEGALSKAFSKLEGHAELPPTIAHIPASSPDPAKVVLTDATDKKIGQAKWTLDGDKAHLNGIYVDTKGAGHGKQLLDATIDRVKQAGAKSLTVGEVNSASPDAISLFDRHKSHPVETIQSPVKGSQARRINFEKTETGGAGGGKPPETPKKPFAPEEKPSPKETIEKAGMKYKGELTKDSGVHQFEHPDHPGKTAALKESEITPENVRTKMTGKIKEFEAGEKMKSEAKKSGSAAL